jgi:hypothetical protein
MYNSILYTYLKKLEKRESLPISQNELEQCTIQIIHFESLFHNFEYFLVWFLFSVNFNSQKKTKGDTASMIYVWINTLFFYIFVYFSTKILSQMYVPTHIWRKKFFCRNKSF